MARNITPELLAAQCLSDHAVKACGKLSHVVQSFEDRQMRDSASSVPGDYTPPDFTTVALQHTNVKLTWDADDDTRKKALRKKMTEDTIRDDDFKVNDIC